MSGYRFPRGNADQGEGQEPLASSQWLHPNQVCQALKFDETSPHNVNPFLVGKLEDGEGNTQCLRYEDDSHIATLAGSRAGKGVSLVIPNLLSYKGSIICVDLKGENATLTAEYRREMLGQEVIVLDPFNVTDFQSSHFNPLKALNPQDREFIDDVSDIAEALIVRGDGKDVHWDDSARSVLKALIMFIVADVKEEDCHLGSLRYFLLNGVKDPQDSDAPSSFDHLLKHWANDEDQMSFVSGMGKRLLNMGENERGSILSTVLRNTEFLDSPSIQDVIGFSDLDLSTLRSEKGATIYLVLPEKRLSSQNRWLRLLITIFLQHLQTHKKTEPQQSSVLFVLDECASLGYMQVIERAMGYIAGFGVKIWVIYQDLSQLKDIYPKRWETFLGNAGILTAFGNIDLTTQDYLSRRVGQCETNRIESNYSSNTNENKNISGFTHIFKDPSILLGSGGSQGESSGWSASPKKILSPLLLPDEIGRFFGKQSGKILILIGGAQPIWAHRILYYEDAPFQARAGASLPF